VAGCSLWQAEGLKPLQVVVDATTDYRSMMDVLGAFLSECCTLRHNAKEVSAHLYTAYGEWCDENGEHPKRKLDFARALQERGFTSHRGTGGTRMWWGLELNPAHASRSAPPLTPDEEAREWMDSF
jgi:putative DNA primase/helicase